LLFLLPVARLPPFPLPLLSPAGIGCQSPAQTMSSPTPSTQTTTGATTPSPPKTPQPKLEGEALISALRTQLDFYFSRANLATDAFLLAQMNAHPNRSVPVDVICGFRKIQQLTTDKSTVLEAMKGCKNLTLDESAGMVRSNIKVERTTLILRDIPRDAPTSEVRALFEKRPGDITKHIVSLTPDVNETWFVNFDSESACMDACMDVQSNMYTDNAYTFRGKPVAARVKSESINRVFFSGPNMQMVPQSSLLVGGPVGPQGQAPSMSYLPHGAYMPQYYYGAQYLPPGAHVAHPVGYTHAPYGHGHHHHQHHGHGSSSASHAPANSSTSTSANASQPMSKAERKAANIAANAAAQQAAQAKKEAKKKAQQAAQQGATSQTPSAVDGAAAGGKKKNKNKNKIAPEGAATAAANGSDGAANALPSSSSTAPSQSASAPRHSSAHKATNKQAAAASTAHTQAAASTPSAPMPALLTRYGVGGDDDDDAPLPRGPIKRTHTHTASTSAAAADSADKTATATEDGQQAMQDDVLFGHKRSAKEERRLTAKKRKAASSTRSSDGSARPSSHKSKKHRGGMTVDTEGDMSEPIDLFTGTTASQHLSRLSDPLSHSTLKAGMVVLGAIRAINEVDLTVQLPHGLTGYVSMREISDPLAEMVDKYIEQGEKAEAKAAGQTVDATNEDGDEAPVTLPELNTFMRVGQLVPCYILSVGTQLLESSSASSTKHSGAHVSKNRNKRIEISMRASLLNQNLSSASLVEGRTIQGAIKSVQEKGYIVDVGVSSTGATAATLGSNLTGGQNITAFLPFNKAPSSELLPPPKRTGRVSSKKSKDAENARRLPIGMPISALISNAQNKRVIVLDAQPSVVNTAVIRNAASKKDTDADEDDDDDDDDASAAEALKNSIGFTNLQPGMLVKATVIQVISDASGKSSNHRMSGGGLYVRFLDFFLWNHR